jgi:hypothetical protein
MQMSEMIKKYTGEWLLIEYEELDEHLNVKRGKVIAHSPDKARIYQHLMETKGKNVSVEFAGRFPEVAVMF